MVGREQSRQDYQARAHQTRRGIAAGVHWGRLLLRVVCCQLTSQLQGDENGAKTALKYGANIDCVDEVTNNSCCCRHRRAGTVVAGLCICADREPDKQDCVWLQVGQTPTIKASRHNNCKVLHYLIDKRADMNIQDEVTPPPTVPHPPPTVPHPLCRIPLAAHRCSECCRGAERLERSILGSAIWLDGLREGVCTAADCAAPTRQPHLESTCASKQIRQQHHESICCVYCACCAAALAAYLRCVHRN